MSAYGINVRRHATVEPLNISADDWEMYATSKPAECAEAAAHLNREITTAINEGLNRDVVRSIAQTVMRKYADLGATDTEPRNVLEDVLDAVFGKEAY
jgi:hypothetical protein